MLNVVKHLGEAISYITLLSKRTKYLRSDVYFAERMYGGQPHSEIHSVVPFVLGLIQNERGKGCGVRDLCGNGLMLEY